MLVDGIGHDLPEAAWRQLIEAIAKHAHSADRATEVRGLNRRFLQIAFGA